MQENFEFHVTVRVPNLERHQVEVKVRGLHVSVHDASGQRAAGVWDAGRYVRYPYAVVLPLPPQLLDEIDRELRLRMQCKGLQERADPPRRSAIGYGG